MEGVHLAVWQKTVGEEGEEDEFRECEQFFSREGESGSSVGSKSISQFFQFLTTTKRPPLPPPHSSLSLSFTLRHTTPPNQRRKSHGRKNIPQIQRNMLIPTNLYTHTKVSLSITFLPFPPHTQHQRIPPPPLPPPKKLQKKKKHIPPNPPTCPGPACWTCVRILAGPAVAAAMI